MAWPGTEQLLALPPGARVWGRLAVTEKLMKFDVSGNTALAGPGVSGLSAPCWAPARPSRRRPRVWDYVADSFVHRLVQSQEDGKLVEQEGGGLRGGKGGAVDGLAVDSEKMDSLQLEYTYLLTSQLEDQRGGKLSLPE